MLCQHLSWLVTSQSHVVMHFKVHFTCERQHYFLVFNISSLITCRIWGSKNYIFVTSILVFAASHMLHVIFSYRKVFNKRSKQWMPVPEKEPKEYSYIVRLQTDIITACLSDEKPVARKRPLEPNDPRSIAPTIASVPAPPMKDLVEQHRTRFRDKKLKFDTK